MQQKNISVNRNLIVALLWMTLSMVAFVFMGLLTKILGSKIPAIEILFFRSLITFIIIAPIFLLRKPKFNISSLKLHLLRNTFHLSAQLLWVIALSISSIGLVFSIEFAAPIWTAILASLLLKENLTKKRIISVLCGFIGVLIIINPIGVDLDSGVLFALVSSLFFAFSNVFTKKLTYTNSTITILFFMGAIQFIISSIVIVFTNWTAPNLIELTFLVSIGVLGLTAHYCIIRALQYADAVDVYPMEFLRLPLAMIIGSIWFNEKISLALILGAILILIGNYFNILSKKK